MIHSASEDYLRTDRTPLFLELTELLKPIDSFSRQPLFYLRRLAWYVTVHVAMLYLLAVTPNPWLCLLWVSIDAVYMLRLGFIAHDLAHGAVSNDARYKRYLGEFVWAFLLGLSQEFWDRKHTLHHRLTNVARNGDGDPDIETPPFILGEHQKRVADTPLQRGIAKSQHILYWMALSLLVFGLAYESVVFLLKQEFKGRPFQVQSNRALVLGLLALGYLANNFTLFLAQPVWIGLLLLLYKYLAAGFVIGIVFALNHVGLPTVSGEFPVDRLTLQTYTSRNVSGPFGRWFWGLLAYQTEHHLWPGISWHKLPEVAAITRSFCERHGIIYNEETPLRCLLDSTESLKRLGTEAEFVPTPQP
ncbi:Fatty acid desaturase [Methylomagnum ishizawai]|uniref:Fatty acid desaturase n=1 Tax=Methylomagnum ishizawai TaxID=1760988 RepID=A0A1Y6CWK1_9GAMM|nr:acyl-CoA desaturase [Methylomagnum ishizawai]SMF94717.1 Fatty acid desaturase [Methylomagnum ishizawai]